MTPWQRYDGNVSRQPKLTVYVNGESRLNAAAGRKHFDDVETVTLWVDPEETRIAIVPGEQGPQPLAISRESGDGGDISTKGALRTLGIDVDELEEPFQVPLEPVEDPDVNGVMADLSALVKDDDVATEAETEAETKVEEEADQPSPEESLDDVEEETEDDQEAAKADADEEDVDEEDVPLTWCGLCGAGPFEGGYVHNHHSTSKGHDGEPVVLDHEPSEKELIGISEPDSEDATEAEPEADEGTTDVAVDEDDPVATVHAFVTSKIEDGSSYMLESREIAGELDGINSHQVGHAMGVLRDEADDVAIEHVDKDEWTRARWRFGPAGDDVDEEGADEGPNLTLPSRDPPTLPSRSDDEEEEERETALDPDLQEVRRAAADVETIQELADALNIREGIARKHAMDAQVYNDLQDEVDRPGVSRA